jgi:hypothetical protein
MRTRTKPYLYQDTDGHIYIAFTDTYKIGDEERWIPVKLDVTIDFERIVELRRES